MVKPHLFLGCSTEKLPIAVALKDSLRGIAHVRLWTKGIFRLSRSALESLEHALPRFDAAVFVLAPDDLARIRARSANVVRDNIIFELGFFIGALGRERTFFVVPEPTGDLHLPSDLAGIVYARYKVPRRSADLPKALVPAAKEIAGALKELGPQSRRRTGLRVERIEFFEDFRGTFDGLFDRAKQVTTFFIHSRSWREHNTAGIRRFLRRSGTSMLVILPEPGDRELEALFRRNFDDGPQIPTFVEDACCFYSSLQKEFPGRVRLKFVNNYPTYSFYKFDDVVIVAMYPTTARKKSVPTFLVKDGAGFGEFVNDDIARLVRSGRTPTAAERTRFRRREHRT